MSRRGRGWKHITQSRQDEFRMSLHRSRQVMQNRNNKKHKILVLTGVSGGMGQAAAMHLIRKGDVVYGLDIKAPSKKIPGLHFIRTDLTDMENVANAYQIISASEKRIDGIVHFAGIYDLNSLIEMNETEFVRIFNINLFANYRVNKTFLPLLKKGGRILITTSELAPLSPLPFTGIYAITKTALEQYAIALRRELQLLGIRVIILRPGAVDTGLLNVSTDRLDSFSKNTLLYPHNAKRFRTIVNCVEAGKVAAGQIALLTEKALTENRPRLVYTINRNPLLLLMNALPEKLQDEILRMILKK